MKSQWFEVIKFTSPCHLFSVQELHIQKAQFQSKDVRFIILTVIDKSEPRQATITLLLPKKSLCYLLSFSEAFTEHIFILIVYKGKVQNVHSP